MAEYKILFNEAFLIESTSRYRSVEKGKYWERLVKFLLFVTLFGILLLSLYFKIWIVALFFVSLILLLASGSGADYWVYKRRLRKSPAFNTEFVFTATQKGFTNFHPDQKIENSWRFFVKARRLPDGFMVYFDKKNAYWWPDSALVSGSVEEVSSLLKEHIPDYRVA